MEPSSRAECKNLLPRDDLDDEETECSRYTSTSAIKPNEEPTRTSVLFWLALAVALVTLVDLTTLFYASHIFSTVFQDTAHAAKLEYANPYIGLEDLYSSGRINASKIDPIILRPQLSAQVFVDEPARLSPRGEHDYVVSMQGTLSPNERHLQVTPKIHTIVQFRTIDFGMEDCRLFFTLPTLDTTLEDHASFVMHPASWFDVFRLATDEPISMKTLSYHTKPRVMEKVATLQARLDGDTIISQFPCARSSLHVFEITCKDGLDCLLDTWSSQNTTYGVNIYQHQTV